MTTSTLFELLWAIGPSGSERHAAGVWREHARFADFVERDAVGNSYAGIFGDRRRPSVSLVGHIDEIGVMVQSIDDRGCLWINEVGGWDPQVLVGQRLSILGQSGLVYGVIGRKAIHLLDSDQRRHAVKLEELWVDIGAKDKQAAERQVQVGDVGVIDVAPLTLPNNRLAARALDNRIGAYVALEVVRRLHDMVPAPDRPTVIAMATNNEETGLRGARVAGEYTPTDIAIAIDVTHATDVDDSDRKQLNDHPLGSGPVILRSAFDSPVVYRRLREAADEFRVPYTLQACGSGSWTDGDVLSLCSRAPATAVVCVPLRYMHSPSEMCDLTDIEHTIELFVHMIAGLPRNLDLTDR